MEKGNIKLCIAICDVKISYAFPTCNKMKWTLETCNVIIGRMRCKGNQHVQLEVTAISNGQKKFYVILKGERAFQPYYFVRFINNVLCNPRDVVRKFAVIIYLNSALKQYPLSSTAEPCPSRGLDSSRAVCLIVRFRQIQYISELNGDT